MRYHRSLPPLLALVVALSVACGGSSSSSSDSGAAASAGKRERITLRLGYFPNITHATAIAGIESDIFTRNLGEDVTLQAATFNAGPAAVEAIFSGALDRHIHRPQPGDQRLRPLQG